MSRNTPCYLLELPGELRSLVLQCLFQDARITFSQAERQPPATSSRKSEWLVTRHNANISILATCKFLRREAHPMFWNTFEMFIPSKLLLDLRDTGLWSHPSLQKMTSLRPQISKISIGIRLFRIMRAGPAEILSLISCFVTDLRYYSNLKRLTLVAIDRGEDIQRICPNLTDEDVYENLSDRKRHETWDLVKSYLRVFNHTTLPPGTPSWIYFWKHVYCLIMNWRSDPIKSAILGDTTYNEPESRESEPTASMKFKVYHQSYQQLQFRPKVREWPVQGPYTGPGPGELPPLIHESEVHEQLENNEWWSDGFALNDFQLVGEHRAFWQQDDPPKRLCDIRNSPFLLKSYPFFIDPPPNDLISVDQLYVM